MSNFSLEESLDALVSATEAFTGEYGDIAEEGLFSRKPKTVEEALNAQKKKISKIKTVEAVDAAIQAIDDAKDNFNAEISKIKDAASAEDSDPKAVKAATKEASKAIKKMASKIKYGAPAAKLIESASSDEAAEYVKSYIVGVKQLLQERKSELSGGSDDATEGKCGEACGSKSSEACGSKGKCGTEACGKRKKACESALIAGLESMMISDESIFEAQEAISGEFDEDGDYACEGIIKNFKARRDFSKQVKDSIPGRKFRILRNATNSLRTYVKKAAKVAGASEVDLVVSSNTEDSISVQIVVGEGVDDANDILASAVSAFNKKWLGAAKATVSGDKAIIKDFGTDLEGNEGDSAAQEAIGGGFDEFGDYVCEGIIKNFKARREFKAQLKDAGAPSYIRVAASEARKAVRKNAKSSGLKEVDLVYVSFTDSDNEGTVTLRAVVPEGTDTDALGDTLNAAASYLESRKNLDYSVNISGDTIKVTCNVDEKEDGAATESYYDSENAPFDILI